MQESIVTVNAGSIPSPQERQADTVIVGAGAAGLFAALVAARRGASVLLLERDLSGPSNLLVSGGLFPGAGSRLQRAGGVEDSAEQFAADVTAKAQGIVDAPVLAAIARQTAPAIHFLIELRPNSPRRNQSSPRKADTDHSRVK